ncbi:hypothetical protein PV10_06245 [Exophiala mesophila]|uniref:L-2,4-diaminobutyrate decarboxylase n=1 Tax=Exophiala mesophila TaxID=212818 RepID=A0A0D1XU64_EXOME|nr:uncharacterized protein PV10_06245 [Exophiala mesophila]KIV91736.1 hypothetical protein PV10_06245 [Exophiala mesophila]
MDQTMSLTDVVSVLQEIMQTPGLPSSEDAVQQGQETSSVSTKKSTRPILPINFPPLDTLALVDSTQPTEHDNSLQSLKSHLIEHILPYLNSQSLSPNYYGFVVGGVTPAALLGDFIASIYDQNVFMHLPNDTLCTAIEVQALNALALDFFRLSPREAWEVGGPGSGGATFTTGATGSNILGLALGREFVLRKALETKGVALADASVGEYGLFEVMDLAGVKKIQVLSTLPHSTIAKAASVVGIGRRNVVSIATHDDPLQIDLEKLKAEVEKKDTLNILAISAGEVNTGRFATYSGANMKEIRHICSQNHVWIHVDGAFGLFGRLFTNDDPDYSHVARSLEGLDLADSITGDCHKLLNVPYDCGIFFTRHKSLSEHVFRNGNAAYLTSGLGPDDGIQSPGNIGLENSRRFRALPVYATVKAYGRQSHVAMLKRQINLARRITEWLLRDDRFQVLPGGLDKADIINKTYIIVLFRATDPEVNKSLVKMVNADGRIYVSGTVWDGEPAARIAVSNWRVDVDRDATLVQQVLNSVARSR